MILLLSISYQEQPFPSCTITQIYILTFPLFLVQFNLSSFPLEIVLITSQVISPPLMLSSNHDVTWVMALNNKSGHIIPLFKISPWAVYHMLLQKFDFLHLQEQESLHVASLPPPVTSSSLDLCLSFLELLQFQASCYVLQYLCLLLCTSIYLKWLFSFYFHSSNSSFKTQHRHYALK